jgi:hypothetical protein
VQLLPANPCRTLAEFGFRNVLSLRLLTTGQCRRERVIVPVWLDPKSQDRLQAPHFSSRYTINQLKDNTELLLNLLPMMSNIVEDHWSTEVEYIPHPVHLVTVPRSIRIERTLEQDIPTHPHTTVDRVCFIQTTGDFSRSSAPTVAALQSSVGGAKTMGSADPSVFLAAASVAPTTAGVIRPAAAIVSGTDAPTQATIPAPRPVTIQKASAPVAASAQPAAVSHRTSLATGVMSSSVFPTPWKGYSSSARGPLTAAPPPAADHSIAPTTGVAAVRNSFSPVSTGPTRALNSTQASTAGAQRVIPAVVMRAPRPATSTFLRDSPGESMLAAQTYLTAAVLPGLPPALSASSVHTGAPCVGAAVARPAQGSIAPDSAKEAGRKRMISEVETAGPAKLPRQGELRC